MRWLVVATLVCAASGLTDEEFIEPKLRMIDHSPAIGNRRVPPPNAVPHSAVDTNFDEAISFSVNTRGELGATRAALLCNCQVLTALIEDETQAHQPQRRSYTAPELRQHVPLVTSQYAEKNDQISFGVNVRGEEGPEFNPTWCTCNILRRDSHNGEEEDEEAEGPAVRRPSSHPHAAGRPSAPTPSGGNPHRHAPADQSVSHIEIQEGSAAPTAAQLAEETINLQTGEGVELKRHSWRVQVTSPKATHSQSEPSAATEYVYRGHKYSSDGKLIVQPEVQVLAELDEGIDSTSNSTVNVTTTTTVEVSPSPLPSPSPSDDAVVSTNVTETPAANTTANTTTTVPAETNEDDDSDPVAALQHLAKTRPHTSALLAQALQAAARQQQADVLRLQSALADRDALIKKLVADNQKAQTELKLLEDMERIRMMTATPSPTPSVSPSVSLSSSPSVSPLPSPSPSASPLPLWEPAVRQPAHPRANKKACYQKCRMHECASLFDTSLRQYAACMDDCASKCYGS